MLTCRADKMEILSGLQASIEYQDPASAAAAVREQVVLQAFDFRYRC